MEAVEIEDSNFNLEVKQSKVPVLVYCWAPWCAPCRMVAPIINKLANDYKGKAKIGKLNVDENRKTASRYQIRSIPTILIFKNGKVVDGLIGAQSESKIKGKLNKWI
ncbi:MAG: thioredoxin [Candidatus Cloacimonadota bacterium]|nr:MAG: thioredoxin [Candidatus Cloacimonadota bacterium]PIE78760.1 MAG: thioredoxin [Candidatus Delongbacteria bacterium]